jgi:serine/threonine protein kinase, bacterial
VLVMMPVLRLAAGPRPGCRLAWHFTTRLSEDAQYFDGPHVLAEVIAQAVQPAPEDRFPTVAAFASAWQSARGGA